MFFISKKAFENAVGEAAFEKECEFHKEEAQRLFRESVENRLYSIEKSVEKRLARIEKKLNIESEVI